MVTGFTDELDLKAIDYLAASVSPKEDKLVYGGQISTAASPLTGGYSALV